LIAAAHQVEHYEIATYGTLAAWAKKLSYNDAIPLLLDTLEEKEAAAEKLAVLAQQQGTTESIAR
jgi:ferritin-like metal-binding protein YciE